MSSYFCSNPAGNIPSVKVLGSVSLTMASTSINSVTWSLITTVPRIPLRVNERYLLSESAEFDSRDFLQLLTQRFHYDLLRIGDHIHHQTKLMIIRV